MLLKMLTGLSGPLFNLAPGDEYDFDDAEAERLKAAEFAVDAEPKAQVKTRKGKTDVATGEGDDAGNG
ncbi:hypothetical protein RFN29_30505 [Mesorhizobium sp. VK22B]|uniref:Uncharacterized protein n=1 Tax=Mesorhizobium captivum TaxID=3072319 RepID=A0ABU4ZCZ8_9HYPH|nr:hypothetical protein [Mesorhizobium sp. VK22B]MDX8495879.1 hypothetical protein [Mesorhizobium sp. VK22B]